MKKYIKIFLLVLFIIFAFGVTTSNATSNVDFRVDENTTAETMLEELRKGNKLTGITSEIKDKNKALICNNRRTATNIEARYVLDENEPVKIYPGVDKNGDGVLNADEGELEENGYAKAYILAAPYNHPEENYMRQWAWWAIIGHSSWTTDLYRIAIKYQEYKETENPTEVNVDENATTTYNNENVVFGPIQIKYSYVSGPDDVDEFREWGGFDYAFFDENDNNISSKVNFCTLQEDGSYLEINSTEDENGFNNVRTDVYNAENLYVVTNDKTINNVKIKIKENKVGYTATVYAIRGSGIATTSGVQYCQECLDKAVSVEQAVSAGKGVVLKGRTLYEYNGYNSNIILKESVSYEPKNCYNFGGTIEEANTVATTGKKIYYKAFGGNYVEKENLAVSSYWYSRAIGNQGSSSARRVDFIYYCRMCTASALSMSDIENHIRANGYVQAEEKSVYIQRIYNFKQKSGCGQVWLGDKDMMLKCGVPYQEGDEYIAQPLYIIESTEEIKSNEIKLDIEIKLAATIEVTKKWDDASNEEGTRPSEIKLKVYRSLDQTNWELLTEGTDYTIEWTNKEGNDWKAIISKLLRVNDNGQEYYFKVEEEKISDYYAVSYNSGNYTDGRIDESSNKAITITNSKLIDLGGYVWLDGQTGIKPALPYNGIMDEEETRLSNIVVNLYYRDPSTNTVTKIADTVTDANGHYIFEKLKIGNYYVEFEYDGVHYEDTLNIENGSSKAFEVADSRNTFNGKFSTITHKQSNGGITLNYKYENRKSTLITNEEGTTKIAANFMMKALTAEELRSSSVHNLNLGLVKRGTDLALSTDVHDAKVTINGQETIYNYNKEEDTVIIGEKQTEDKVSYNLNLYASDYNYRIEKYVKQDKFKENNNITAEEVAALGSLDSVKVNVVYELNLQNQTGIGRDVETGEDIITTINEVKYDYDEKYTLNKELTAKENALNYSDDGSVLTINTNATLKPGETKTIYLVFDVEANNNALSLGDFSNKAEITSYSTSKGFIDLDSQPGNFINSNQVEDDNDTAGGLEIAVPANYERTISGKVFDDDYKMPINDVIVQLIELKAVNNNVYEYIWQETVSGTGKGLRLSKNGKELKDYEYSKVNGYYEFKGFIPGDYIVRFIYGDGTTYDMTEDVVQYNGQDYKSVADKNYKEEWYNIAKYTAGESVARDNEARRLETMAYSVEINSVKGVLLKLLNNVTPEELNETEKEIIIITYNYLYDSNITEVTSDVINKLLKEQVLKNTWMCAETSKIKVAVETKDSKDVTAGTQVDGTTGSYAKDITNINLGLELRPDTEIELKKYITGMKLIAANGQTLVNAKIDVNEHLHGNRDISNKVQGIKDNVTILDNVWQYEVVPTEINTIVDGANLEFEYTLVVRNTSETDFLSTELAKAYNESSTAEYKELLRSKATAIKGYMRSGTYASNIGNTLGSSYYKGGIGEKAVLTEVTSIRDYINNDLTFVTSGKVAIDKDATKTHRILTEKWEMQEATINTILKTTESTGKMESHGEVVLYTVTLGKNPISSTGNLNFENYIAEVMSFTNAAGRRAMTSTPGNAEIIDHEYREGKSHEPDEADTGRIQIGAATGEDIKTNYVIIIAVAAGIALVAIGAYIVKKYIIK